MMKRFLCSIWAVGVFLLMAPQAFAVPSGFINGLKWHDLNGDGIKQVSEPGLANWEITLVSDDCFMAGACSGGSVNLSTMTNAMGFYDFFDLTSGTYTVSEVLQAGWTQTFPLTSTHTICLNTGADICGPTAPAFASNVDFGNKRIPEPAALALFTLGLAGLGFARRRKAS